MNKFYLFMLIILFTGCSEKTTALGQFKGNEKSAYAIQYTKKSDIQVENESKVMLFATYLNKVDKEYESDKTNSYIIGIHLVNQNNHDLEQNALTLTQNEESPMSIQRLEQKNELIKFISLKNFWGYYYLVKFKKDESKEFTLKLLNPELGETQVSFQK